MILIVFRPIGGLVREILAMLIGFYEVGDFMVMLIEFLPTGEHLEST